MTSTDGFTRASDDLCKRSIPLAEKRYGKKAVPIEITIVQKFRRKTRKKSLEVWNKTKSDEAFDKDMLSVLFCLRQMSRVTRYKRSATRRLKGLFR